MHPGTLPTVLMATLAMMWTSITSAQESLKDSAARIDYGAIVYFFPESAKVSDKDLPRLSKGLSRVESVPAVTSEAVIEYSVTDDFANSYAVPDEEYLEYFGRGLTPEQAGQIQASKLALLVNAAYPSERLFDADPSVSRFLYEVATVHGGLIWDSVTRELFSPELWRQGRLESWDGKIPSIKDHITIHAYDNGEGIRAISLGMSKFALPDIVVNNFAWSEAQSMGNLINLVAQSMVEGASLTKEQTLSLSIEDLADTNYKRALLPTLKENAVAKVRVQIGDAKWEEGDPDNQLIEILFDNADGDTLAERHDALTAAVFGWEDPITYIDHNELILEASRRAKGKLKALRKDFRRGLAPGEYLQVKAPFIRADGGNEWMWVEVISWKGKVINGLLRNEPYDIPDLKAGAEVVVDQGDVFDYIRSYSDGTSEGNETGELIARSNK